ncbi:MAG: diguanylate cyclase [Verrucomicrobia bacterium]|nr:diguanylate cyclase [Verrucomicrobiota bacterium]MBU4429377.1 diguanylate cyclase [Verrucomicrobiota bacterium]MCG2680336.1 diguanylate cyclase [Kiritimatiellia bacterium]
MHHEINDYSAWLIGVFDDLCGALTFEQALHVILERMKETIPHQSVAILMVDGNTNELLIRNARQISYSFIKKLVRAVQGDILPRVLLKHEMICLNDAKPSDPDYPVLRLEHDFKNICLAPVIHHQRAVGYIHCDRAEGPAFSPEESRRLQVLGRLIGLLMEKFDLLELTQHLGRIDDVTKALKYHAFVEEYYRELARAKAYRLPLSLIFVDIDDYASFMSTCGINAGHILLDEVRRLIVKRIRKMDVVGRFSADQFIVCLGGMNRVEATATLEAIRQDVQDQAGRSSGSMVTLTGVAMTFERPEDFDMPLAKVLATLGSGLITAHSRGSNQVMTIDLPRV